MIGCTLIIRPEKGEHDAIARAIYTKFLPTVGMKLGMRYSTEKSDWEMDDLVFVQITHITCFLDGENKETEEPIQMHATINTDHFPHGLDDLKKWWKHLDNTPMQNPAHESSTYR